MARQPRSSSRPYLVVVLTVLAIGGLVTGVTPPAATADTGPAWVLPVGPPAEVVRGFEPPAQRWSAGHRGVDLGAPAGAPVRAAAAGTISYAGLVAGRPVVVVDHGTVRTTYEPVAAALAKGARVEAGTVIGRLDDSPGHCAPAACLHWGALRGEVYVDPMSFVGAGGVRLLPLGDRSVSGDPPPPPRRSAALDWPVAAPSVTSPFGMRRHPVTGVYKLHDGTDFRAPCGSPIRASAAGVVTGAGSRGAYGLRIDVDHGAIGGVMIATSYSHLSRLGVGAGDVVAQGQVVGWSGTTGRSTGCHLHFMVYAAGSLADPMDWLPARQSVSATVVTRVNAKHSGSTARRPHS